MRPSWRGGALLRWQPTIQRGGALPFVFDFVDTCWCVWRGGALAPTLGSPYPSTWCALLEEAMRPSPINKELLPLIC